MRARHKIFSGAANGARRMPHQMTSSYWTDVPFFIAFMLVIAFINSRRFVLKNVGLYWCGILVFGLGTTMSAFYHVGSKASAWGLVSLAGVLAATLSAYGWPPRRPTKRPGWF